MGLQDRYFGRWLLPIFPIACVLGAYFVVTLAVTVLDLVSAGRAGKANRHGEEMARATTGAQRERGSRPAIALAALIGALVAIVLLAQGAIYSAHNDLVLARADTRNLTREWMVAHVPRGASIVVEPVVLNEWIDERPGDSSTKRWLKYPALQSVIAPDGKLAPQTIHEVALEDYETTLAPALIGWYERQGYCWVVSGSTESGRAFAQPGAAPLAVAYYRALAAQAEVVYHVSPYQPGAKPPAFNFDWTFDDYPLSYERPGPEMTVYRLRKGRCA
jgi:hypothetical protein